MSDATKILQDIADAQHWPTDVQLTYVLEYIDNQRGIDAFQDYLNSRVAEDPFIPFADRAFDDSDVSKRKARAKIFEALKALGATIVTVDYSGGGDEGYINEVDADVDLDDDLAQKIEDLCEAWMAEFHGGWENCEGGCGNFVFHVKEGYVHWSHGDYVTETTDYEYKV